MLFCCLNIVNSAVVNLDCTQIEQSFALQTQEVYAGEFTCLPTTANGSRTLLRFATVLNNLNSEPVRLTPYNHPIHLLYEFSSGSTVLRAGYVNVTCLRDTSCGKNPMRFMHCKVGGIGAGCNMTLNHHLDCQWVDITGLFINAPYTLELQLAPGIGGAGAGIIDTTPCTFTVWPNTLSYITVGGWQMQLGVFLGLTGLPVLFIIVTCVLHHMQKPPNFNVKHRQMYRNIQYKME